MTTLTVSLPSTKRFSAADKVSAMLKVIQAWSDRARSRSDLAKLSDWQLADIGVSREQAELEAAKPFWQA
jgi:uncharacterized protein YjiS (DUF1127 family)